MNKLSLILLLALIANVINESKYYGECIDFDSVTSQQMKAADELDGEYCSLLKTSGEYTHCCLFEYSDEKLECGAITDDQYENIGRFKKYMRDDYGDDDIGIDCSSKFISFSLLVALALLF